MMKNGLLMTLAAVALTCVALALPPANTSEQQFVDQFTGWLNDNKVDVSKREIEALHDAHRLLAAALEGEIDLTYFCLIVRNSPHKQIEWEIAKQIILKGQVVKVTEHLSLDVTLITQDGRSYLTKEPKINDVLSIVREIDPKEVFILYKNASNFK